MQQKTKGTRAYYYQSFRFKVEVDGVLSAAFARVSGLGMRVETAPYRVGTDKSTSTTDIPGLTNYDHVRLERGVVGDYDMLNWILSVCSDGNRPTGERMRRQVEGWNMTAAEQAATLYGWMCRSVKDSEEILKRTFGEE